jgi:polyphosphate kinase
VVAIKQTLYRTSQGQPDRRALIEAAEAGKNGHRPGRAEGALRRGANIRWARDMERGRRAGRLRLRRATRPTPRSAWWCAARAGLRTYCHFGTGNYHPVTAKIYTDLSLFTCDPALGRDAAQAVQLHHRLCPPDGWRSWPSRR